VGLSLKYFELEAVVDGLGLGLARPVPDPKIPSTSRSASSAGSEGEDPVRIGKGILAGKDLVTG
jgi:hypothetical protein